MRVESLLLAFCLLASMLARHYVQALGHCTSLGVYLNDDFDASTSINTTFWSSHSGVLVQTACTANSSDAVLEGNVLVFGATGDTSRHLTSKSLNLKNARAIQFDAAACPYPAVTSAITIRLAYSIDGGKTYQAARYFTVSKGGPGAHVVVNVTSAMTVPSAVHLRIEQNSSFSGQGSQAWALDNFAVLGKGPQEIDEDFDSVTPCHFLGHSRDDFQPYCSSSGNALMFSGQATSSIGHFVTTVPLFIPHTGISPGGVGNIFSEDFEPIPAIPGVKWANISGGRISVPECGAIDKTGAGYAAYFNATGIRSIETQSLDLRRARSLSFKVRIGGGSGCEAADSGEDVVVEYRLLGTSSFTQFKLLAYDGYKTARLVTIILPPAAQAAATTIRWRQLLNSGNSFDEWAIDAIRITDSVPSPAIPTGATPTAAPTLTIIFADNFDTVPTIPGALWAAIVGGSFTTPDCGTIDLSGFSSRAAFFSQTGSRYIQTVALDLSNARAVSFRIRIGGSSSSSLCETADSSEDVVLEYKPAGSSSYSQMKLLAYNGYTTATAVAVIIPSQAKTSSTVLQWRQLSNSGATYDEWALDHVQITGYVSSGPTLAIFSEDFYPTPAIPGTNWQAISSGSITTPECGSIDLSGFSSQAAFFSQSRNRYIQTVPLDLTNALSLSFRVLLGGGGDCEQVDSGEDVVVEYGLSGSITYTQLRLLTYNAYTTAQTVSIPLPAVVKTTGIVLRWRQLSNSGSGFDEWAIDHIRIAGNPQSQVPTASGSLFREDFYPKPTFGGTKWLSITGGTVSVPDCGGIDLAGYSSLAAFFSLSGTRSIQTQALDLRLAQTLSFRIRIGGGSGCETADQGEDVVVEYRTVRSSVFQQIITLAHDGYTTVKTVTVALPTAAQTSGTYIRWRQLSNSGSGFDEWALDHVRISSSAYNNRHSIVEFRLCMGCGVPYTQQQSASYDIQLEYSVNYGQTWGLVQTNCLPSGSQCMQILVSSQYSSFLFKQWRRLTVVLPTDAISNNTEIRWRQPLSATGIKWAVDDLYLGIQCPSFCSGHGRCTKPKGHYQGLVCGGNSDGQPCARSFMYKNQTYHSCTRDGREGIDNQLWCSTTPDFDSDGKWGYCICGVCQCDSGYSGKACETVTQNLPRFLNESFEDDLSSSKWGWVAGGTIDTTCGTLASGSSMVFNLGRSRLLETVDLDLTQSTTLQFTIQVGSFRSGCPRPTLSSENIFLQYSTNGGVTWNLMKAFAYSSGTSPSQQNIVLLNETKTTSTRIRWYQPIASGSNLDVWALDDVYIDSVLTTLPVVDTFDPIRSLLWKFYTGSKVEPYCSSSANALHFSYSYTATSRFASSVSLQLTRATYIQFDIAVDCGQTIPSSTAYVTLQYSINGGSSWSTLDSGCSPLSTSCGTWRRPSIYRSGLYSRWRRVTIAFSDTQLASSNPASVQLRWLGNSASTAYEWGIDNVYIGEGCPGVCSGRGWCTVNGTCSCDPGYFGSQCSSSSGYRSPEVKERFDQTITPALFTGGRLSTDCGVLSASTAMTFNLAGERELVTPDMNATNVRFVQFSYTTGSLSSSAVCAAMQSNSQVAIGDYSTNGGVSWTALKDLRYYYTYRSPTVVTAPVPDAARTESTLFRLWQYGFFTSGTAAWAVDDIFIGGYTVTNGSYLFEMFEPLKDDNWLFYPGGQVSGRNCSARTPALYFDGTGSGRQHATSKIFTVVVEPLVLVNATFETSLPARWSAKSGQISTVCGTVDSGSALVFNSAGLRELTTPDIDTTVAAEVQFYLMIGGNPLHGRYCDNAEQLSESVKFYYSINSGQNWTLWETYQYDQYKDPQQVTEKLPDEARTTATHLRWVQSSNDGKDTDVWSIDSIVIIQDVTPVDQYVAQFDINIGCGQFMSSNSGSISFDFITHGGSLSSWKNVEQECVPGSCSTGNYLKASSYYSSGRWQRVTIALPLAAVSEASQFRWYQSSSSSIPWAIDSIYIGHDCPTLCSGHGRCMPGYCVCDAGYTGNDCSTPLLQLPTELRDDFSNGTVDSKKWSFYQGVTGTQPIRCGPVSGPNALLFAQSGPRQIITVDMNTLTTQYLQFRIRIGTYTSSSSTCNVVDSVDEGVLVHHSNDGGITWQLLKNLPYNAYTNPGYITIELPTGARSPSIRFRWWQPHNQGVNRDEWVLGDIFIGGTATNKVILEERFDPIDGGNWLFYPNGQIQPFCQNRASNDTSSGNAIVFSGSVGQRFITTRDLAVFSNANLVFDLNIGCGSNFSSDQYNVQLQYSTNRGNSWNLVCNNPSSSLCGSQYAGTSYRAGEFRNWRRVSVILPSVTASNQTRFRWYQSSYSTAFSWAIDNVFIGASCPNLCSGHGRCRTNTNNSDLVCDCDNGYGGIDCQPTTNLSVTIAEKFENSASSKQNWLLYEGGAIGTRCGVVASGKSLSFYMAGTRMAVTRDLNLTSASVLLFFIQMGGGSCSRPSSQSENVIVQYSTNGGISWTNAVVIQYYQYTSPSSVTYILPNDARKPATRFRWWQASNSGVNYDIWSIDEIYIGGSQPFATSLYENFVPDIHSSQWTWYVNGHTGSYCNRTNTLVFDNSQGFGGSRVLISQPLNLNSTSSSTGFIQFWLNIGCGANQGSGNSYDVQLQYAVASPLFQLVQSSCLYGQTSSSCPTNSYHTASSYSWSLTGSWRRITVSLPSAVMSSATVLRWFQQSFTSTSLWAISGIYVGEGCPNMCSGHGNCTAQGICNCDTGFGSSSCVPTNAISIPKHFSDDFDSGSLSSFLWTTVSGGTIGTLCGTVGTGQSLYFNGGGLRLAETVDINVTEKAFIQFEIVIGRGGSCETADSNEDVLLQYSTNGGITWQLLSVLGYSSYRTARVYFQNLPQGARTNATRFRWWQTQHSGSSYDHWAIDDVSIGVYPANTTRIVENFNPINTDVWTYYRGSTVGSSICYSPQYAPSLQFYGVSTERSLRSGNVLLSSGAVIQFSMVMGCNATFSYNKAIQLQYSSNIGSSWQYIQSACQVGSSCSPVHFVSSYYSDGFRTWKRVTLAISSSITSLTSPIQFRWLQQSPVYANEYWALDNIYVGSDCPSGCTGHGQCVGSGKCNCDFGYSGPTCSVVGDFLRNSFHQSFESSLSPNNWLLIVGGYVGQDCGILAAGNSLVLNSAVQRQAVTVDLDTQSAKLYRFTLRMGGGSCRYPSSSGEGVAFQYSINGGITWTDLSSIRYYSARNPTEFSGVFPSAAQTRSTRFRWLQASNSGPNYDVWSIDDVYIGSGVTGNFYESFEQSTDKLLASGKWISLGSGTEATNVCSGSSQVLLQNTSSTTAVQTGPITINSTGTYVVQFDLLMKCGIAYSQQNPVIVEYNTNAGAGTSWTSLRTKCFPGSSVCLNNPLLYARPTTYYSTEYKEWRRVTIPLPAVSLGTSISVRWRQSYSYSDTPWAIDNVFVGLSCPNTCSGHGSCQTDGSCLCDSGFGGTICSPIQTLPTELKDEFEDDLLRTKWGQMSGGSLATGCGPLAAGKTLYFSQAGLREVVTVDLDTRLVYFTRFYIRVGGTSSSSSSTCDRTDSAQEGVLFQYSKDGGITWRYLYLYNYYSYRNKQRVALALPPDAQANGVRFRWWQPYNSGAYQDEWAIDNVYIGGRKTESRYLTSTFDPLVQSQWLFTPSGSVEQYCQSSGNALVFKTGTDSAQHDAITQNLRLSQGDIIQFEINAGCGSNSFLSSPVTLNYATGAGQSVSQLVSPCRISDLQSNRCAEPSVGSIYYADGSHGGWGSRVTIVIPSSAISNQTRFLWQQSSTSSSPTPTWALDNIYIGPPCPGLCSGHGRCMWNATLGYLRCLCDPEFSADNCSVSANPLPTSVKDDFESSIYGSTGLSYIGGSPDTGCGTLSSGKSLYFSSAGQRAFITLELDTRNTRLIQFYIRIGSSSSSSSSRCDASDTANEGVLLLYSTNYGITWNQLQLFNYYSYRTSQFVNIRLPSSVRTPLTRFAWWQPQNSAANQDEWAIDDVYIGGDDLNPTNMFETFDPINDNNWVFYHGAAVNSYCGSKGHSLVFSGSSPTRSTTTREVRLKLPPTVMFTWNGEATGLSYTGGSLGRPCTSTGPSNVIFFNKGDATGNIARQAITREIDTTAADFISFNIIIGGSSGLCEAADNPSEGVKVYFSTSGSNWTQLRDLAYNNYGTYREVTINLPVAAKSKRTRFSWKQGSYSQAGVDTWALGSITVSSVDPPPNYQLQFDVVFSCNSSAASVNSIVQLQMSTESSPTWTDVNTFCRPPGGDRSSIPVCKSDDNFSAPSRWFWHGDDQWKRVTVSLMSTSSSLTEYTRFRFTQVGSSYTPSTQPFAIDNIAIRPSCPNFCSGHGLCLNGTCVCDYSFSGLLCNTLAAGFSQVLEDSFDNPWPPRKQAQWASVIGGGLGKPCSTSAGSVIVMSGASSLRQISTIDLDTRFLTTFMFTFRLGGGSCDYAERGDDVYLSYSKNGGVTWTQIKIFDTVKYRTRQTVNISDSIPSDAMAAGVRFQWTQYQSNGASTDVWIIDDVIIGGSCSTSPCRNGGTCTEIAVGSHTCSCPPGFTGLQCDQKINPCLAKPCRNGGTCTVSSDGSNYICTCPLGFSGQLCDISTSVCVSLPCQNNGTCQDLAFYSSSNYDPNSCIGRCGKFIRGMPCQCDNDCSRFPPGCCKDISTFCGANATSYVCKCMAGYEGLNCEKMTDYCAAAPCLFGATCTSTLTGPICQCASGFIGSRCEVDIDECNSNPCQNGGTCTDGTNSYTCLCAKGYNGYDCETKIDYCLAKPCGSGSTCISLAGDYSCNCKQGYTGRNCTQIIDNCAVAISPCANGGRCINSIGSYTCQCGSRFTGSQCQTEILPCSSFPCVNKGTCVNKKDGNYTCQCVSGYSGNQCEIPPPACYSNPCTNNGTCVSLTSKFFCYCLDGWTGYQCETEVNECQSSPCQHLGTCIDRVGYFECQCVPGYSDSVCGTNVDDCSGNPCLNGGSCTDGINDFSCTCSSGFTGEVCNVTLDSCLSNPCIHGQCKSLGSLGFDCRCNQGYSGIQCGTDIDECSQALPGSNVTCYHGGTCINRVGYYDCSCAPGYTGIRCETELNYCSSNPCSKGATCQNQVNGYKCLCPPGVTGQQCQSDIDECLSNPCMNEGVCSNGNASYLCGCEPSFTGTNCETQVAACTSNPCMNGGQCSELMKGGFSCSCPAGYHGVHCETVVDFCAPAPCQNGGTCVTQGGGYQCRCSVGYSGKNCSQYTGGCGSDPCHNDGVCHDLAGGNVQCVCVGNYTGTYCQIPVTINHCASNPCQNHGTCQNTPGGKFKCLCMSFYNGTTCEQQISPCNYYNVTCSSRGQCSPDFQRYTYTCNCSKGYTGKNCEKQIDYCRVQQPCKNGATCNSLIGGYSCTCPQYYTGKVCQTAIDPCDSRPSYCHNGGTCVGRAGTGSFQCQCPIGLYGNQCDNDYNECKIHVGLCQNGGRCINFFGGYQCVCCVFTSGDVTTGKNCETILPSQCVPNPCQNGGRCAIDLGGSPFCVCPGGFTGKNCSTNIDECRSSPCQHDGKCEDRANGYYCNCENTGYEGPQCEKALPTQTIPPNTPTTTPSIPTTRSNTPMTPENTPTTLTNIPTTVPNPCATNPCKNGGSCILTSNKLFSCTCQPGYTGELCADDFDECHSHPCQHGGQCQDKLNHFQCNCSHTGFTGPACSEPTPTPLVCDPNPCFHEGVCREGKCQCSPSYTGQHCEKTVHRCNLNPYPCKENEVCVESDQDSYTCTCRAGYGGAPCRKLTTCNPNPCLHDGTCTISPQSKLVTCSCIEGYSGSTCQIAYTSSSKQSSDSSGTATWVYVIAVVGGVLIVVVILGIIILYKKRVGGYKISGPERRGTSHISNPLYGQVGPGDKPISFEQPIDEHGIDPNNFVVSPFDTSDGTNSEAAFAELEY